MDLIKVTCAIILFDQKILVVQRSEDMMLPLKWEFPGGKIEKEESEENCIIREIKEELNAGKGLKGAIEHGFSYKGAFSAILDANVTSMLTGIILYVFEIT